MNWKNQAKEKFNKGINSMSNESDAFIRLLIKFNKENNLMTTESLTHSYLLPEGAMWLMQLKDDSDILVEKCSYQVINSEIDYVWIDYDEQKNEIIVEINNKDKTAKQFILLSSDEIVNHHP